MTLHGFMLNVETQLTCLQKDIAIFCQSVGLSCINGRSGPIHINDTVLFSVCTQDKTCGIFIPHEGCEETDSDL